MFPVKSNQKIKIVVYFIFFFSVFSFLLLAKITTQKPVKATTPEPYYQPIERFGITIPYPTNVEQLIEATNVRALLDWRIENTNLNLPEYVEYIHVIRVSDASYSDGELLNTLPDIIQRNPGDVWIIGNEPDRFCYQDSVSPEVYGDRYFNIANLIRSEDPNAKLGFGSVVQPTPIRIRYLQRTIDKLVELSGNNDDLAMSLIDIWSIHAFILNEHPFDWGAGVPVGFYTYTSGDVSTGRIPAECFTGDEYVNDWSSDAIKISDYSDTYSIEIFEERIRLFRDWMNSIGERDKPLWITEYGSLFPPIDPPPPSTINYVNVSDETSAKFMVDSFNFLISSYDSNTGLLLDDNRLVQRWFWYSLNDYRYKFGGSLFDPENDFELTPVGDAFLRYTNTFFWENRTFLPLVLK